MSLIGTLAQEEKERRGTKFFGVTVEILESEPRLRPGMTARLEIQVEKRPKALFVPVDAVFEREGRSVVYMCRAVGPRPATWCSAPRIATSSSSIRASRGERVSLTEPGAPPSDFVRTHRR